MEKIERLLQRAKLAIAERDWEKAKQLYLLALGQKSDLPDIHYGLATVYFQPRDRQPSWFTAPRAALDALRATGAFVDLGSATETDLPVVAQPGADAEFVRAELVTDQYLEALRLRPRIGRLLSS